MAQLVGAIKSRLKQSALFNFNQVGRDRWVAAQASALPAGTKILDVGAGSCRYRPLFAHCDYKTQDFKQLSTGDVGGAGYGKIDFICDVLNIPAPNAGFDAILCTEVLEHVPEPIRLVKELARLLRLGGKLILTAPLGSGLHQQPYHYYGGYTPYWYQKFLAEAGFTAIRIEANGGFFKHYGQESLRFARMLAPRGGRARILLTPLWLISLPWFALVCPLLCGLVDRLDTERGFTTGYHVTATRL